MRYSILFVFSIITFLSCSTPHKEDHDEEHEHEHDHAGVVLNSEKASDFGIEYETVVPGKFHHVLKATGSIESSTADINTIVAKKSGIITLSPGISIGTSLDAGETIGMISSEGVQGGDTGKAAIANLNAAKTEYESLKPLYEEGLVTASVYREAERLYKEAEALAGRGRQGGNSAIVSSPVNGDIRDLYVKSGEFLDVGTPIATIAKNSSLMLRVDLPARESGHLPELETANFIPEGSSEVVKLSDVNGKRVSGNKISTENGYVPLYFSFTGNPVSFPGGYAEVYLICSERSGVISLPREAFLEIQGNKYVYVAENNHEYEKRLVKTGATDGERIEVKEGLKEGERVVSKGASIIRMAEMSSIAPPAHTHNH